MPASKSAKIKTVVCVSLIIIIGFTVYLNSLGGKFIWDDSVLVSGNPYIRSWSGLSGIFTKNIWAAAGDKSFIYYRPLQILTYLTDYSFWRLNPFGYHLTSVSLHLLTAVVLYWFISLLFGSGILALFSSLLFVVHPTQVAAVSYISGRADPLAAVFLLLSFIFYIKSLKKNNIIFSLIMLLSFVLALLSRENAIILPALLLVYHYAFKEKIKFSVFLPYLLVGAVYLLLRCIFISAAFYDLPEQSTLIQRLPGFFVACLRYLRILFLPFDLHMEYGNVLFGFRDPGPVLGGGLIILLVAAVLKSRISNRIFCFSALWFLVALLPVSNLYPINSYMAEHWLYLPSIGFFIILGRAFAVNYEKQKSKIIPLTLFILLITGYGYLTAKQNNYWSSEILFFKRTLEYSPGSASAHNNLGVCYFKLGNKEDAAKEYLAALKINPGFVDVYRNLGKLYYDTGNIKEGLAMYWKAIRINPGCAEAYSDIADIYVSLGKNEEGINYYQMALSINPESPSVYYNLGNAYYNLGQKDKAMEMTWQSIKLNPFYLEAYNNLAAGYAEKGEVKKAIDLWNECLKIDPDFTTAHFNLAVFYFRAKNYALAIKHCDRVVALGGVVDRKFIEKLEPYRENK